MGFRTYIELSLSWMTFRRTGDSIVIIWAGVKFKTRGGNIACLANQITQETNDELLDVHAHTHTQTNTQTYMYTYLPTCLPTHLEVALDTYSPADSMPTQKPTELSRIKQKLELNIPSLWWVSIQPIWLISSRLNARWQTDWAIEGQAKNSTAHPYDRRAFNPLDPTAVWHSHLELAIYMFVVVNFDDLARASDFKIERRQVVFLCWMQDSNPECLWNRISSRLNARWQTDWGIEDQADSKRWWLALPITVVS